MHRAGALVQAMTLRFLTLWELQEDLEGVGGDALENVESHL